MSGRIPFAWIEQPDGVKYRAVVNRNAPLPCPSEMMVCTELLPSARARLQDHKRDATLKFLGKRHQESREATGLCAVGREAALRRIA
jgi:hypothetical protein